MQNNDTNQQTADLSRRSVLQKSTAVSAALALGMGTITGSAAGQSDRQGGTGFVPEAEFIDAPFRIIAETPQTLTRSPSCDSSEPEQTYQGYEIIYEEPPQRATLFVNPERNITTDSDLHEFVRDKPCGSERKVTFKPRNE